MRIPGLSTLARIDESTASHNPALLGLPTADTVRRTLAPSEVVTTTSSSSRQTPVSTPGRHTQQQHTQNQGLFTPPQTPASPPSSSSSSSSSAGLPSSNLMSPSINELLPKRTYFSLSSSRQSSSSSSWQPMASTVSSASPSSYPSVRRQSQSQLDIGMEIESDKTSHTLLAPLGENFTSDGITIAAKRNNVLLIIADRWDQEKDSHIEWEVTLDRDADMSNVQAQFTHGLLKVTVQRKRIVAEPLVGSSGYRIGAPSYQ
ncbi:hypothetical protein FRC02_001589 [Tulasnella sp. 418]|nr:hypothetical protein FRC02_001589 [Tulasnella sp. 418]